MDISELLAFSVKNKASDLHLSAGLPPMIRVHGDVRRINLPPLEHKDVHGMIYDIMNDSQRKQYDESLEVDFSFDLPGPGPLPRQRLQPGPRSGRRPADHSVARAVAGGTAVPAPVRRLLVEAARPGAGDGADRVRQVDHARRDGRPREQQPVRARADDRGPDRVRAREPQVRDQPARGRPPHALASPMRCARRCARTPT